MQQVAIVLGVVEKNEMCRKYCGGFFPKSLPPGAGDTNPLGENTAFSASKEWPGGMHENAVLIFTSWIIDPKADLRSTTK